MSAKPINILAIEDNPVDALRLRETLLKLPRFDFRLRQASRLADGLTALETDECDVVLLDLVLPDSSGLDTVDRVHHGAPQIPIIVLTHVDNESNAVEAVRRAAQDYLFKTSYDGPLLSRSITYAIERKRAETAAEESAAQRHILEGEVLKISTHEQQRISQDLHDSVGQQLTGLSYLASSLAKQLAARGCPEAEIAKLILEGTQQAQSDVQSAIRGLTPVELDTSGLMVALNRLVAAMQQRACVQCDFVCAAPVPVEDNGTATHLYRIAQEALHNAARHAGAQHVRVSLRQVDGDLVLQVRDDGVGLPPSSHSCAGMGLRIMNYRAHAIGATLEVTSNADAGTSVTCTLKQECQ